MRRINFLVPSVASTPSTLDELMLARIGARHIHVIAREDRQLEDQPKANVAQSSDLVLRGGATLILPTALSGPVVALLPGRA